MAAKKTVDRYPPEKPVQAYMRQAIDTFFA
jgi:hypothetical protein